MKQPTICKKCKHYLWGEYREPVCTKRTTCVAMETDYVSGLTSPVERPNGHRTVLRGTTFVTYPLCSIVNTIGDCPDFKNKPWWRFW